MTKRRRYRAVLLLGTMCLLIVGAGGLWLRFYRRQEALNCQLVAALVKYDTTHAMALVNDGADPNTTVEPLPPPSLRQLWNYVVHRSSLSGNHRMTAFLVACGAPLINQKSLNIWNMGRYGDFDFTPLVEVMLQHGANVDGEDQDGRTGLIYTIWSEDIRTLDILLEHGANVNKCSFGGGPPLYWAVSFSGNPSFPSSNGTPLNDKSKIIIRRLLAHGADPNLSMPSQPTPLQIALQNHRSDLVALLKQAGAKK